MLKNIYMHSGWRSASTYLWSAFRKSTQVCAYYEPFHEQVQEFSRDFLQTHDSGSWESRHPEISDPYFFEYLSLVQEKGVPYFSPDFPVGRYFEQNNLKEKEYLNLLLSNASRQNKVAFFGFCRSLGRVGLIKEGLDGFHIVTMRDPFQQWLSCRSYRIGKDHSAYFELSHFLILCLASEESAAGEVANQYSLPRLKTNNMSDQLNELASYYKNMSDLLSFKVHLSVYLLSYFHAIKHSDMILDVDALSGSQFYRSTIQQELLLVSGVEVDFSDCKLPQAKYQDLGFDPMLIGMEVYENCLKIYSRYEKVDSYTSSMLYQKCLSAYSAYSGVCFSDTTIWKRLKFAFSA